MEEDNPFSKSQTVHPEVRAYVYSLVNALGGSSTDDDGRYVLGDDALACLRDLKRWLKLYDEKNNKLDVARCLAEAKLVGGDLIPILASWPEDGKENKLKARVALACLELLVPLTWPLENGGEMTLNHHRHTPYIQQAQVLYKAGILGCETSPILRQVIRIGLPSIAVARDERTTRDEGILKLMLYFFRNVAVIDQIPNLPSQGLENEVSRSATIEAFRDQDVFALLLTMCSNMGDDFNHQDVIILDIIFNLIKGVDPKRLWMTEQERTGQGISDLSAALALEDSMNKDAKRNQWTRHGRFGTMLWVKREGEKVSTVTGQDNLKSDQKAFFNMDKSKKWSKPQQRRKDIDHTIHDFDHTTWLTNSASEKLRNFVEEFLDSGFNPFFSHLRKAIQREAERLQDINYRQFFYAVAWFMEAERVRRETRKKDIKSEKIRAEFEDESYALVAAVLNQETFIMLNRYMQISWDNKEWQDLNASMRCFTQILLTVQEMAQSPLEEDQEIADNIQNNIFYEETTHDRIVGILKSYKDQGFGYLDACTELSHVFLRMLERYSKENADLQIRSRRRARRKRKEAQRQAAQPGDDPIMDDDEKSENEDIADVIQVSKERKFDFNRFAAKFASQASVNTFVSLLSFYRDLTSDQLKRAHRFLYRVAFKQDLAVLLYRVDIVALLYKIVNGPDGLDKKNPMYRDYSELSRQLFKKMFKKIDQRPELVVEMLFSKIPATLYYLEFGHEKQTIAASRPPVDLEIRPAPGRDVKEQIGIVVTVLLKDGKTELVKWVKDVLGKAFDERHSWEAEAEVRRAAALEAAQKDNESTTDVVDIGQPSYITVRPTSDDIKTAMFKNGRLRLLMRLVGFEMLGDEDVLGASWIVPSGVTSEKLAESKLAIERYESTPWQGDDENEDAEDLIRRARNKDKSTRDSGDDASAPRDAFIDDSEGEEEFLFPDNPRKKRTAKNIIEELKARRKKRKRGDDDEDGEIDEALAAQRRAEREKAARARRLKIKSEAYIRDSDDESDEEKDRLFFEREEQLRKNQAENIRKQMALDREDQASKTQKKRKLAATLQEESEDDLLMQDIDDGHAETASKTQEKRREVAPRQTRRIHEDSDDDLLILDIDDGHAEPASSQTLRKSDTEAEEDDEDTPLSSQSSATVKPS
ncbi:Topoisomerase 1-associated factor 1 [Exophiala dermatitidis]|uniref:Topoisomerase 1-associated factor 1 n=2 Tax=Exophiala dermatitidis TaxID=5970 RepID=H6BTM9_EXODN|nr:replication fork protection complex subunit Swi1/Tof1 [Exophiala dermatitidis NIH/UT8656]KAJ4503107.1 Topoisomerase 1-associated factor 1 [Exophiala dermatitidis]EHY55456.1 replication fork protection complex subunit Swi1/Tof1 [Exophiala dermatitidis NIH/UT8656]KAJ4504294.1 Topoisomerase 1-associated factor 1 [Exophiala dermatitidis]KAJ4504675.1 Topoisomerase 1-associated factor 1 [Exophiala dermatitidis]KAJ4533555.1 Topoisomerase 1-associated factor 1 [Exophiala dermatitidis]